MNPEFRKLLAKSDSPTSLARFPADCRAALYFLNEKRRDRYERFASDGRRIMPEKLLTVRDVAEQLGVGDNWVHCHASGKRKPLLRSLKVGKVPALPPGRHRTIPSAL